MTDKVMQGLASLTNLTAFYLVDGSEAKNISSDDAIVTFVKACTNLVELSLAGLAAVSDETLVALGDHCASLQFLHLNGCSRVTDAGIAALTPCENLEVLELTDTSVTQEVTRQIRKFTRLWRLEANILTEGGLVDVRVLVYRNVLDGVPSRC